MKTILAISLALAITIPLGCTASNSPESPEGAYRTFVKALTNKNYERLYLLLDKPTLDLLSNIGDSLLRLDKLPQAPQNLPGGEDRAVFTKAARAEDPARALLSAYFTAHAISYNEEQRRGSEPEKVDVKGETAIITTRGGEEVQVVKEGNNWKVTALYKIFANFKNEIEGCIAKSAVPPKAAETPDEAYQVLMTMLKDGNYDTLYFMLDSSTRKALDDIAVINQKLVRRAETNTTDKELTTFLETQKTLKATRNGREILVAIMNRYAKPGSVEVAGATLPQQPPKPEVAPENINIDEVTLVTSAGEKIRFIKETSEGKIGWHTDYLLSVAQKALAEFQQYDKRTG